MPLHEILFTGHMKKVCIEYNIQVPLCQRCHHQRHHATDITKKGRKQMDIFMCEALGIDYYKALQSIAYKNKRSYLELVKERCKEKIKSWEV